MNSIYATINRVIGGEGRALCPGPCQRRGRLIRWVYHPTNQSLLMAPIEALREALSDLWDTLAQPAVCIGTEAF